MGIEVDLSLRKLFLLKSKSQTLLQHSLHSFI